jgi:hypothetical protein
VSVVTCNILDQRLLEVVSLYILGSVAFTVDGPTQVRGNHTKAFLHQAGDLQVTMTSE